MASKGEGVSAARTVTLFGADGSARVLPEDDELEGEDILVGFRVPLAEVFGGIRGRLAFPGA